MDKRHEIVVYVFDNAIPIAGPKEEVDSFINTLPKAFLETFPPKILYKASVECKKTFLGIINMGETPTGCKGHYMEIYKGSLIPFKDKPLLQCAFYYSGKPISCRFHANEFNTLSAAKKVFDLVMKSSNLTKENGRIFFILCNDKRIVKASVLD